MREGKERRRVTEKESQWEREEGNGEEIYSGRERKERERERRERKKT